MKLILHPGHPKCGSTSIQRSLLRNRRVLENHGVYFPDDEMKISLQKGHKSHIETPRRFFKVVQEAHGENLDKQYSLLLQKLKRIQEFPEVKTLILSAENLINQLGHNNKGRRIHEILNTVFEDVVIVYVVRQQSDYLLSSWQQWDHKVGADLDTYVNKCLRSNIPNYLNILEQFSTLYCKAKIHVLPMRRENNSGWNLIKQFYTATGLNFPGLNVSRMSANKTLNPLLCDALALKHDVLYKSVHDQGIKKLISDRFSQKSIFFGKNKGVLSESLRVRIFNRFKSDNKVLNEKYMANTGFNDIWNSKVEPSMSLEEENGVLKQLLAEAMAELYLDKF